MIYLNVKYLPKLIFKMLLYLNDRRLFISYISYVRQNNLKKNCNR